MGCDLRLAVWNTVCVHNRSVNRELIENRCSTRNRIAAYPENTSEENQKTTKPEMRELVKRIYLQDRLKHQQNEKSLGRGAHGVV